MLKLENKIWNVGLENMKKKEMYDCLVVGCGIAGIVIARELAERASKKILILEMRDHIGGNAYDLLSESGIFVHQFGPHIFHTDNKRVFDYLSRFTEWWNYAHEVVGDIHGQLIPIPFNLNSLHLAFEPCKAARIEQKLIAIYGFGSKVPILDLRQQPDTELAELADFIYNNIFLYYTQKQWGLAPDAIASLVPHASLSLYLMITVTFRTHIKVSLPKAILHFSNIC